MTAGAGGKMPRTPAGGAAVPELTLESLAARLTVVERELATLKAKSPGVVMPTRDWQSVVGMFEESEFMRQVDAEVNALRDAEQKALDQGAGK
jgi:hypothetical protein